MEQFSAEFQNEEERKIVVLALVLGIIFSFIPFLLVMFMYKDKLGDNAMNIIKAFCNFDFLLFIIIFAVGVIPVLGLMDLLVSPVAFIFNLIIILNALKSVNASQSVSIPVVIKLF